MSLKQMVPEIVVIFNIFKVHEITFPNSSYLNTQFQNDLIRKVNLKKKN